MFGYLAGVVGIVAVSILTLDDPCSPKFEIGQTYNEIKAGPCKDIEQQAAFRVNDTHVAYYCPSQNVMVVGDVTTGKMDAFFLYRR